ncbi:hypothetical protein [Streptomyces chiangmaiensis]|uniref:Radical SAM protein n=1 Tax=Streptomyces chiangmaiensis TaxID=766497 RepID=A0ABU7FKQ6_9ACTN|nr:hypothetical protein [Streptomyces chiangmaiensis]MED7824702.1 hypothetical protein [Streptomyces chiangmaiensis]
MRALLGGQAGATSTLADVERLAQRYGVPVEDALLIAINLHGIDGEAPRHRARLQVRLDSAPSVRWQLIVPLNAAASPFRLIDGQLLLGESPLGFVERVDADEAVGGYFRGAGTALTLNPNARSRCVGCAFCPNTLEAAADPRLSEEQDLRELLAALREQHPRRDLTGVREVTVSTGCFEREPAAVDHLRALRSVLAEYGIEARLGFLTSVLRSRQAFDELADVGPFVLRLTAECFTRRDLLLKASKAVLTTTWMPAVLRRAVAAGHSTSFTYIAGLDDLDALRTGVEALAPYVTEFPNFQVYQAHNRIMAGLRVPGAQELEYYLRARNEIEKIMKPSGLRPAAWECYRPLWYFTFADESLVGA